MLRVPEITLWALLFGLRARVLSGFQGRRWASLVGLGAAALFLYPRVWVEEMALGCDRPNAQASLEIQQVSDVSDLKSISPKFRNLPNTGPVRKAQLLMQDRSPTLHTKASDPHLRDEVSRASSFSISRGSLKKLVIQPFPNP